MVQVTTIDPETADIEAQWRGGAQNEALRALESLFEAKGETSPRRNLYGVWLQALGRIDEALKAFERSAELQPNFVAHYNVGCILLDRGDLDSAIGQFDASIARTATFPEAHTNRGIALFTVGRVDEASAAFDAALALDPDFLPALRSKAILAQSLKRVDESEALFREVVARKPTCASAACELAESLSTLPPGSYLDTSSGGRDWRALVALHRARELAGDASPQGQWLMGLEANVLYRLMHASPTFSSRQDSPLRSGSFWGDLVALCELAMSLFPSDAFFPARLGDAHDFAEYADLARTCWQKAILLDPGLASQYDVS